MGAETVKDTCEDLVHARYYSFPGLVFLQALSKGLFYDLRLGLSKVQ